MQTGATPIKMITNCKARELPLAIDHFYAMLLVRNNYVHQKKKNLHMAEVEVWIRMGEGLFLKFGDKLNGALFEGVRSENVK